MAKMCCKFTWIYSIFYFIK